MPPKNAPNKKVEQKKKEKIIEDKTFGLKNKKGAKTQKYVQQVTNQAIGHSVLQIKHGNVNHAKIDAEKAAAKKKTADELRDLNKLLKPVTEMPKVARDIDPKSVVCLFYKQGMCHKGEKCKFSHDLSKDQKTAKKNLYVDSRDLSKEDDNIDEWDESKLNEVAEKKHGEHDRKKPNQTDIVCKYFLEAVENSKYGWFWECPNGDSCIYRHALPPGYVLKKDRKKLEEHKRLNEITLEELIEKEVFGILRIGMSGRDLFTYNPDLVVQDEGDMEGGVAFERGSEEEDNDEVLFTYYAFHFTYNFIRFTIFPIEIMKLSKKMFCQYPEIKAFEIDERTFYCIDDEGHMLDDDLDDDEKLEESVDNIESMEINEDLFNVDEIPDFESSEDEDSTVKKIARIRIEEKNRVL
ncbi:hypothetical protein X798_05358 [Onchocerca flexuosa]|uniref:C3H1-type domain-containing protein n=1 Tax=Onchocerca flexuosa TaxID=387005 RepID=A0A238BQI6_9BILA|nr:hypothetical protein X798_05358 [Onchocerca flexuosa]